MSKLIIPLIGVVFSLDCDQVPNAVEEKAHPSSEFVWSRHHLSEGVAETLTSPRGQMRMIFHGDNLRIVNMEGRAVELNVLPPASILWAPNGRSVAINNGNGSGQMSHLLVVSNDRSPSLVSGVEEHLKAYFIERTGCRIEPSAVSVSADGWAVNGTTIWVSFESWDRQNYCDASPVHFAQYDFSRRRVVAHLSADQTMARFCSGAGFRQQFGPNCREYDERLRRS